MYTEFYGLKEKPFNLTPSPRFIYMSEGHKEAMALLTYGVTERKGFILLTGEVGTGKTTMIHNLINNLDAGVEYVYLVNPILSPQEFVDYLAFSSFKKRVHFKSKADFLLEFEDFLKNCFQNQKIFILIIDEAHKLSFELLEEVRLLSNMEFAEEKLINIFLVGQPELNENLNSPKGRATLQRIGIRYDIPPLSLKETGEYLDTRLKVAGAPKKGEIFQKDAVEAIHRFSQGYPRTINILADNAMLLGYSSDKKTINASMIEESYNSLKLEGSFLKEGEKEKTAEKIETLPEICSGRPLKWIFISSLLLVFVIAMTVFMVKRSWISIPGFSNTVKTEEVQDLTPVSIPGKERVQTEPGSAAGTKGDKAAVDDGMQSVKMTNLQIFPFIRETGFSKSVLVKDGDTLIRLAEKVYGNVGEEELELLKRFNPEITNLNNIDVGQKIAFPIYTILINEYEYIEKAESLYQQLKKDGYDANVISSGTDDEAEYFQVSVGAFKNRSDAESFAFNNLEEKDYNMPRE
jgi:type II secretory pathway predicted ATPase ExeA